MWQREFPTRAHWVLTWPTRVLFSPVGKWFISETPGLNLNVFNFPLHLHPQWRFSRAWKQRVPDLHLITMDVYCALRLQLWFQGRIGINLCTTTLRDRQSAQGRWAPKCRIREYKNLGNVVLESAILLFGSINKTCHKNPENVTIPYGMDFLSSSSFLTVFLFFLLHISAHPQTNWSCFFFFFLNQDPAAPATSALMAEIKFGPREKLESPFGKKKQN